MSYTSLLINSASVYRFSTSGIDGYGKPVETWAVVSDLEDIACRIQPAKGKEVKFGAEVVIADYKLFLGDVILSERDKVYVYWGTTPAWYEYEILMVEDKQDGVNSHHKECYLRIVR